MELLDRGAVTQLDREPIEQIGVRRKAAHFAQIVRRVHDAPTEVIVPESIRDRAPGEDVLLARDPVRERQSALSFATFYVYLAWDLVDRLTATGE